MKPKINRVGEEGKVFTADCCQTPSYALDPLLPYLPRAARIWESACGRGNIVRTLGRCGRSVVGTDLQDGFDFFKHQPKVWDIQTTNPPYSIKYAWLERSYQLKKPFALLLPLETLGAAAQRLMQKYGYELILLNRRVNFTMPHKKDSGSGAQFPVAWFTWGLQIGAAVTFGTITPTHEAQLALDFDEQITERQAA